MKKGFCSFFFLAFSTSILIGQTKIIGLASTNCSSTNLGLATQDICSKPDWCMTDLKENTAVSWAGAATWDSVLGAAWVSDGSYYAVIKPKTGCTNPCQCQCTKICSAQWPIKTYITGMAIDSNARILFISDSNNFIYTYTIARPCSITQKTSCKWKNMPQFSYITGLAYSKFFKYLFVLVSSFSPFSSPVSYIYVAKASSPCTPMFSWKVPECSMTNPAPCIGLAYDDCRRTLFISDSNGMVRMAEWDTATNFRFLGCCKANPIKKYYGLGVTKSGCKSSFGISGKESSASNPCPNKNCPTCSMTIGYTGGEPVAGNTNFKVTVTNVPKPVSSLHYGIIFINLNGNCSPNNLGLPCGPIILYPNFGIFLHADFTTISIGSGNCGIKAEYPIPIPPVVWYCCHKMCGQFLFVSFDRTNFSSWCFKASKEFWFVIGG